MSLREHLYDKHMQGHENFLDEMKIVSATTPSTTADFMNQFLYNKKDGKFYIFTLTATATKWKALET